MVGVMVFLSSRGFIVIGLTQYGVGVGRTDHQRIVGWFLFLFLLKGVSGRPSFLRSLVIVKKLSRRLARVAKPRPWRCFMANIRSALPEDISNVSREVKPIRLRALVRIRAQPGRVRLSRCSSRMFLVEKLWSFGA